MKGFQPQSWGSLARGACFLFSTCMPQIHTLGWTPFQAHTHACIHTHTHTHACLHCLSLTHPHTLAILGKTVGHNQSPFLPGICASESVLWFAPCLVFWLYPPCFTLVSVSPSFSCLAVIKPQVLSHRSRNGEQGSSYFTWRAYYTDQRTLYPELFTEFVKPGNVCW